MAALGISEQGQNRLVLGNGLAQRLSPLLSLLVYFVIGIGFLSQFTSGDFADSPILPIAVLFFGFLALNALYSALVSTRVVLDAGSRLATRSTILLGFPLNQYQLSLDRVRRVLVQSRVPVSFNQNSSRRNWRVVLEPTDGAPLVVNSGGTHDEMLALGNQVAALMNRPLADDLSRAGSQTAASPGSGPIQDFGGGATSYSPPVAAPSLFGGSRPASSLPEKTPPVSTPTPELDQTGLDSSATPPPPPQTSMPSMPALDMGMPPLNSGLSTDTGTPAAPYSPDTGTAAPAAAPSTPDTSMPSTVTQPATGAATPPSYSAPAMPDMGTSPIYTTPAMELPDQPPIGSSSSGIGSFAPSASQNYASRAAPARTWSFDELTKALQADPTDSMAYYRLARFWHSRRAGNQALEAYQNATRLDPMNGEMQNDLGVLYYQRGNMKDAETALRRAIGLDPFGAQSHYNLGLVLMRTGRVKDAQQEFSRAAQTAASDAEQQRYQDAQNGKLGEPLLGPQP